MTYDIPEAPSLERIEELIRELVHVGVLEYAGYFQDGLPMWRLTKLSGAAQACADVGHPGACAYLEAINAEDDAAAIELGRLLAEQLDVPWRGLNPPRRTA